jgi:hypothetical protein
MREDPYVTGLTEDDDPEYQPISRTSRFEETWAEDDWADEPAPQPRPRPRGGRQPRASRQRTSVPRPNLQKPSLPPAIANADIVNDMPALVFVGLSTLGLAAMAIVVANRVDAMPPVIATHVSASGVLENFASRSTIWQVPLLTLMLTLMNLVAAWFVSPLDRFASRFLLATGVIVQFVAWVALFRILW